MLFLDLIQNECQKIPISYYSDSDKFMECLCYEIKKHLNLLIANREYYNLEVRYEKYDFDYSDNLCAYVIEFTIQKNRVLDVYQLAYVIDSNNGIRINNINIPKLRNKLNRFLNL